MDVHDVEPGPGARRVARLEVLPRDAVDTAEEHFQSWVDLADRLGRGPQHRDVALRRGLLAEPEHVRLVPDLPVPQSVVVAADDAPYVFAPQVEMVGHRSGPGDVVVEYRKDPDAGRLSLADGLIEVRKGPLAAAGFDSTPVEIAPYPADAGGRHQRQFLGGHLGLARSCQMGRHAVRTADRFAILAHRGAEHLVRSDVRAVVCDRVAPGILAAMVGHAGVAAGRRWLELVAAPGVQAVAAGAGGHELRLGFDGCRIAVSAPCQVPE
jgi:hypothetical protein